MNVKTADGPLMVSLPSYVYIHLVEQNIAADIKSYQLLTQSRFGSESQNLRVLSQTGVPDIFLWLVHRHPR